MGRFDGKTEQATPRRKREARREGRVAKSPEVGVAASLLGLLLALRLVAPRGVATLRDRTALVLSNAGAQDLPAELLRSSVTDVLLALLAPLLALSAALAVASGVGQVGLTLAPKAARPKLSNLSPKRGLQRLKPSTAGWELVRSTAKLALLAALLAGPLRDALDGMRGARDLGTGLAQTMDHVWTLLGRAVALAAVVAVADYLWNRRRTGREMRMSKEEVKREAKDSEGDPLVRAQRRRRATEISRNRMLREVATADVVVTNPTHLAVALAYRDGDAAPRVVAKGANRLAARIRSLAHRHGVPVTEDKPLARILYRRCRLGQHVPSALYEAVAVVLAVAYRRRGRRVA